MDNQGRHYRFEIDLHKSDGWFDTGVPVTADLDVLLLCGLKIASPTCENAVEASIGGRVFKPTTFGPNMQRTSIATILPNEEPRTDPLGRAAPQSLQLPEGASQTIKLRIVGDNSPDELNGFTIKIYVRTQQGSQQDQYTPPQQIELAKLATWRPR